MGLFHKDLDDALRCTESKQYQKAYDIINRFRKWRDDEKVELKKLGLRIDDFQHHLDIAAANMKQSFAPIDPKEYDSRLKSEQRDKNIRESIASAKKALDEIREIIDKRIKPQLD